jgi:hypothetical protein
MLTFQRERKPAIAMTPIISTICSSLQCPRSSAKIVFTLFDFYLPLPQT